jgi:phosphatidylglycerophosphate synthase
MWGKWKATVQFVAIVVAIINPDLAVGPVSVADVALWIAVVVTVVSAGDYFSRFRGVLSRRERDE